MPLIEDATIALAHVSTPMDRLIGLTTPICLIGAVYNLELHIAINFS